MSFLIAILYYSFVSISTILIFDEWKLYLPGTHMLSLWPWCRRSNVLHVLRVWKYLGLHQCIIYHHDVSAINAQWQKSISDNYSKIRRQPKKQMFANNIVAFFYIQARISLPWKHLYTLLYGREIARPLLHNHGHHDEHNIKQLSGHNTWKYLHTRSHLQLKDC